MTDENQPKFYTVAIYMEDKLYGGPEEGGWYYHGGELVTEPRAANFLRGFDKEEDAQDYADALNLGVIAQWNEGRPEISSALSEGRYVAIYDEGMPKPYFPEETPHYD
jgi:hypothetical protein